MEEIKVHCRDCNIDFDPEKTNYMCPKCNSKVIVLKKNNDYEYGYIEYEKEDIVDFPGFYTVIDKKNNRIRPAYLLDVKDYNNYDLIECNDFLYILRGQFLYQINGSNVLGTNPQNLNAYKKVNVKDYIENNIEKYSLPVNTINNSIHHYGYNIGAETDLYERLQKSYYNVFNDLCGAIKIEDQYDFRSLYTKFMSLDKLKVEDDLICWDEIDENINPKLEEKEANELSEKCKKDREFNALEIAQFYQETELYDSLVIDKILTNGKVKKLLLSAIFISEMDSQFIGGYIDIPGGDYSYLILNYVKAFERFLSYKLDKKNILKKDKFYSLDDLKKGIIENENILLKDNLPKDIKIYYYDLLDRFRKNYRNGYFHKHLLEDRNKAEKISEIALDLIVLTEIIMK